MDKIDELEKKLKEAEEVVKQLRRELESHNHHPDKYDTGIFVFTSSAFSGDEVEQVLIKSAYYGGSSIPCLFEDFSGTSRAIFGHTSLDNKESQKTNFVMLNDKQLEKVRQAIVKIARGHDE